jgi:cullin 1
VSQKSKRLEDVDLLQYYRAEWVRYTTGANYLNRLFAYINRFWVKRERDEGKKAVYQVYTVSGSASYRLRLFSVIQLACSRPMERLLLPANTTG